MALKPVALLASTSLPTAHEAVPLREYEIRFVVGTTQEYVEKFCELFPDAVRYGGLPLPAPAEAASHGHSVMTKKR